MAYIDYIYERHETNTSWMTEAPINIHEYRIISCLDEKKTQKKSVLKRTLNLEKHLNKDRTGANFCPQTKISLLQEEQNLAPTLDTKHVCATI